MAVPKDKIDIAAVVTGWGFQKGALENGDTVLIEMYADFIEQTGLAPVFNEYARDYDPVAALARVKGGQ